MKTAIIYSTKYGHTEKLANLLKGEIKGNVEVINLRLKKNIDLQNYDTLILGGSVYIGKVQKELKEFVAKKQSEIEAKNFGIFLTCGDRSGGGFAENFEEQLLLKSKANMVLGFGLDFEKLKFFEKLAMKAMKKGNKSVEKIYHDSINTFLRKIMED